MRAYALPRKIALGDEVHAPQGVRGESISAGGG
jgi:hypothetical protein